MEARVDGLLHLGALAIATTAVYVGLDRIKTERDTFSEALSKTKEEVREYISNEFDIDCDSSGRVEKSVQVYAVIVLCYIAYARTRVRLWTIPFHVLMRHRHVFCYRYFYGRNDIRFMRWACALSLLTYFHLVALQLYGFDLDTATSVSLPYKYSFEIHQLVYSSFDYKRFLFWSYASLVFWTFGSVLLSAKLQDRKSVV